MRPRIAEVGYPRQLVLFLQFAGNQVRNPRRPTREDHMNPLLLYQLRGRLLRVEIPSPVPVGKFKESPYLAAHKAWICDALRLRSSLRSLARQELFCTTIPVAGRAHAFGPDDPYSFRQNYTVVQFLVKLVIDREHDWLDSVPGKVAAQTSNTQPSHRDIG